jgi:hypothetical protein
MPHVARIINGPAPTGRCRLFLRIAGTIYGLSRLDRPRAAVLEGWRLTKRDGTTYDVGRTEDGIECSCPDFIIRRDGIEPEGCKHVRALVAVGLIGKADDDRDP